MPVNYPITLFFFVMGYPIYTYFHIIFRCQFVIPPLVFSEKKNFKYTNYELTLKDIVNFGVNLDVSQQFEELYPIMSV